MIIKYPTWFVKLKVDLLYRCRPTEIDSRTQTFFSTDVEEIRRNAQAKPQAKIPTGLNRQLRSYWWGWKPRLTQWAE